MAPLQEILSNEARRGLLPFARFMELALYHEEWGYYERQSQTIGLQGDYYTSASVGSLFGQLLGFQFLDWHGEFPGQGAKWLEAGAHDGRLAEDILGWLRRNGKQVEYGILEPSPRRQAWQRQRLNIFAGQVRWFADVSALPKGGIDGVIFANELLDALPVHRLGWDAKRRGWFEWGVKMDGDEFAWERMPQLFENAAAVLAEAGFILPMELAAVLPDGFTIDVSSDAAEWWRAAARALRRGRLVAMDYGFLAEDFLSPQRFQGTARAYREHRLSGELLRTPGEQDLTAHVNFTQLRKVGEAEGLETQLFTSQEQFLDQIAARAMSPGAGFGEWTPERVRQFQTLTHPEHLGRAFQVLVQSRQGFAASNS
jgi:SAM-dependent MidA family methyltransferase